ncbi:jg15532, partial [Pararge aegeria aegeria]
PPKRAIQLIGPCVKEGVGTAHKPDNIDAERLRMIARKSSTRTSANIADALQCRGFLSTALNTLLY